MTLKKAIATPKGTIYKDLEDWEVVEREEAYKAQLDEEEAQAPYIRLAELDIILPRVVEDVAALTGRTLTEKEQSAKDEKASIRASLKK